MSSAGNPGTIAPEKGVRALISNLRRALQHPVPKWSSLRVVANTYTGRLTILIPLIGYLVIFNRNILPLLELSHKLFGQNDIAPAGSIELVSLRLIFVYFGLMVIALGSIGYQICCPVVVKSSRDAVSYADELEPNMGAVLMDAMQQELVAQFGGQDVLQRISDANSTSFGGRPDPNSLSFQEYNRRIRCDLLIIYYLAHDHSRKIARATVASFYAVGFLLLAFPSGEVFVRVVVLAWEMLRAAV